jgi:hypothetical protein
MQEKKQRFKSLHSNWNYFNRNEKIPLTLLCQWDFIHFFFVERLLKCNGSKDLDKACCYQYYKEQNLKANHNKEVGITKFRNVAKAKLLSILQRTKFESKSQQTNNCTESILLLSILQRTKFESKSQLMAFVLSNIAFCLIVVINTTKNKI